MAKVILLLLVVYSALLNSCQAWVDVKDRIKGRVIHLETLLKRGRWLRQIDNKDSDGSRYLFIDPLAERDTYYEPRVQFEVTACDNYLCLEALSLRDYFLAAGYPPDHDKHTVKLQYSTYPAGDTRFFWTFLCEDLTMERCKVVPKRFENDGWLMVADNKGNPDGEHYDATCGKEQSDAYFRIHAPNPTDGYNEIFRSTNTGTTEQTANYMVTTGVTQTEETSSSVTSTVSTEIGGAFKAFSASASSSISSSWSTTQSSTFSASKSVKHVLTIPPRTTIILTQLIGNYAKEFEVGEDKYTIEEIPLDSGATRKRKMPSPPGQPLEEKSEL
ncbi:uncharacterized protein LOC5512704 [Nematostella vectensis]|uniref:uncharacterized protein LOC5512704 n=1 Tax=Nematostella vectensis TaxID=45351 RepID=UPI0020771974|nr:uncharacterized protein LOC5512704 [Nematostella vectensis]